MGKVSLANTVISVFSYSSSDEFGLFFRSRRLRSSPEKSIFRYKFKPVPEAQKNFHILPCATHESLVASTPYSPKKPMKTGKSQTTDAAPQAVDLLIHAR